MREREPQFFCGDTEMSGQNISRAVFLGAAENDEAWLVGFWWRLKGDVTPSPVVFNLLLRHNFCWGMAVAYDQVGF